MLKIEKGYYKSWDHDQYGKLAKILVCDQFSRFIYRGLEKAYALD